MESSETNMLSPGKRFPVRVLAYTAGLLDGEGCITGTTNGTQHSLFVFVGSSNHEILEWLQGYFGGTIVWNGVDNPKWKRVEKWLVPAKSLIPFLKLMVPFLKIKQKQAYKAMSIRSMIERKAKDARICTAIKALQELNQAR